MAEDIEKKLIFESPEGSEVERSEAFAPSQKIEKSFKDLPETPAGLTSEEKVEDLPKPEALKKDSILTEKALENAKTPDQVRAALASGDAQKLEELAKDPGGLLDSLLDFQEEKED